MASAPGRPPPSPGLFQLYLTRGCLPTASLCLALLNRSLAEQSRGDEFLRKTKKSDRDAHTHSGSKSCAGVDENQPDHRRSSSSSNSREVTFSKWKEEDAGIYIGWQDIADGVAASRKSKSGWEA